jgi:hypothetical protein
MYFLFSHIDLKVALKMNKHVLHDFILYIIVNVKIYWINTELADIHQLLAELETRKRGLLEREMVAIQNENMSPYLLIIYLYLYILFYF